MRGYLGIDVGSVSTNLVLLAEDASVLGKVYRRTQGDPIRAVQRGLEELLVALGTTAGETPEVLGVGATGSARKLTGVIAGADVVKNEITAHAVAALHVVPEARTVLEIGGQDSKLILLREGVVTDFAMNTVCAAGTGSFLDHQSTRLGIPIEDFGEWALRSERGARIAGRCGVFAESDMIHKQQVGYPTEDIIYGLCESLVRNFLNNLAKGKSVEPPVVFQGGVAANRGMIRAFGEALGCTVDVPEHYDVMGAVGSALLASEHARDLERRGMPFATAFKGFEASSIDYSTSSFHCKGCANTCEIVQVKAASEVLARWGGRCGKWEDAEEGASRGPEPVLVME